jgi:hypothetical protein
MTKLSTDEMKAILGTYGTVKQSGYGSRWYLSNDYGKAMGGNTGYYRQEGTEVMLAIVEREMWRTVQRLENRSKSFKVGLPCT